MASKTKTVGGIKYAAGVEPAQSGSDPQIAAMLAKKGKIRVTTMIDEDVLDALKARAADEGHGHYQTTLNAVLRESLMPAVRGSIQVERLDVLIDERFNEIAKKLTKMVQQQIAAATKPKKKGTAA